MRYIPFVLMLLLAACEVPKPPLLIMGEQEITEKEVNGETVQDTQFYTIPPFRFLDQDSNVVTNETVAGKVYVADFFFTFCPTICPKMTTQMLRLHNEFLENEDVVLLSHTIAPAFDTIPKLKDYADKLDAQTEKWHFLWAAQDTVYKVANSYHVKAMEDEEARGGFNHDGSFVLVDRKGRIRGRMRSDGNVYYNGTDPKDVDMLIEDMYSLIEE